MKKSSVFLAALATIAIISCNDGKKTNQMDDPITEGSTDTTMIDQDMEMENEMKMITFKLEPKSNSAASGTVTFEQDGDNVKFKAELKGLKKGTHAIHIHESSDCSSPDGKSAGGHWNPTFMPHGKWGDDAGYHKGDIGNFEADADGNGEISMTTDEWCIGCDDEQKNIFGKSIIVHEDADDFKSQPSGDAGARALCGGIIK